MLFWLILVLLLSGLFSGSEIAFVSANKLSIQVRNDGRSRAGRILSRFYQHPKDFLGTMLVGNNIALVIFTTLLAAILRPWLSQYLPNAVAYLLVLTLIGTVIVLIFGEYLPKILFKSYSTPLLYGLAIPLRVFSFLLYIPTKIMTGLSTGLITKVLRVDIDEEEEDLSRQDLESFIDESISEHEEEIDAELLKRAIQFDQIKVRDCMVPRTEISYVDRQDSLEELIEEFRASGKSRVLVVDEDIDHVIGYIHHQKILTKPKSLRRIMMDLPIVPEVMPVNDLLLQFIKQHISIACVVDEFGSTSGIITMEDILEEIFGEIEDEHDMEDLLELEISEMEYLLSGRHELDYLMEKYEHLHFPEGEYHTLSGYIVMTSGTIPDQGEELELEGVKYVMEEVTEKKIEKVRVILMPKLSDD